MRGLVIGILLITAVPTAADPRDDVMARAARCGALADSRQWLNCFYGAAQPMRQYLGLPAAPPAQTGLVPGGAAAPALRPMPAQAVNAPPMPRERGFFSDIVGSGTPVVRDMAMASYSYGAGGAFSVTLADGQVWSQTRNPANLAHWNKPAQSYRVTITPGAMGTYNLRVAGLKEFFKVVRVR